MQGESLICWIARSKTSIVLSKANWIGNNTLRKTKYKRNSIRIERMVISTNRTFSPKSTSRSRKVLPPVVDYYIYHYLYFSFILISLFYFYDSSLLYVCMYLCIYVFMYVCMYVFMYDWVEWSTRISESPESSSNLALNDSFNMLSEVTLYQSTKI
jgi:hypothetical protein